MCVFGCIMRLRNEIFAHVLDWLIQNNKVEDQKDLALKTGISQNTVSRIMTGKVEPSDDTLRKLNATFGNIFNMQYLRGESIVMLIEDVAYYKSHPGELNKLINGEGDNKIDQSSLVNAALAAKDQLIEELKEKYDKMEAEKDARIAELKQLAEERLHRIAELRRVIDANEINPSNYPFTVGVADTKKHKHV